jgi:hypothetical protein
MVRADVELRERRFENVLATTERALTITTPIGGVLLQGNLATHLNHAKALLALERSREALAEVQEIEPGYARVAPKSGLRFDIAAVKALALARVSRSIDARAAARAALELLPLTRDADPQMLAHVRSLAADMVPSGGAP